MKHRQYAIYRVAVGVTDARAEENKRRHYTNYRVMVGITDAGAE